MTSEKLNAAVQLIEAGNRQVAVPVLRELIRENARDEDAWLLLYTCMDQVEHKKFCLQSVLTINPENQEARDALAALTEPVVWEQLEREAEWEKIDALKMEWEKEEPDEVEWVRMKPKDGDRQKMEWEKAEPETMEPLKMDWEEVQPAKVKPLKAKPVKAISRHTLRRKTRSKQNLFIPIIGAMLLFLMLFTVCVVFMMQIFAFIP